MRRIVLAGVFLVSVIGVSLAIAQDQTPQPAPASSDITADYPMNRAGILIQDSSWEEIAGAMPTKTKAAHGFAASLSYGAVPAKLVAEYDGEHAATVVSPGQPIICICHIISLPGQPVIVVLHLKKGSRELDGGRMYVAPVVGGSKIADANKSDLLPVDMSHPEDRVWLIRPQVTLVPGEYALMLGTQNINIYPFTIAAQPPAPAGTN